jgi:hypothetical protein
MRSRDKHSKETVGVAVRIIISTHNFSFGVNRIDLGSGGFGYIDGREDAIVQHEAVAVSIDIKEDPDNLT